MKTSQAISAIKTCYVARRPLFLHGQPGVGKSDVVRQAASDLGCELRDVRASQLESVDLRGLPYIEDSNTHWSVPNFLPPMLVDGAPNTSKGILFLDEMNQANQSTQAAAYQLILDRRLGDYILPEGWVVIAAGNRAIDRAIVQKMGSALKSRFVHIEVECDSDEWLNWAYKNAIHPSITGYIKFRPDNLNDLGAKGSEGKKRMEAALESNSFAVPRTWAFASQIIHAAPPQDIEYDLLAGTIGQAAVADFVGFLKIYRNLPDLDGIIKDPDNAPDPKKMEPQVKYALASGLAAKANQKNMDNIMKYVARMPAEFQVMIVKEAQARDWNLLASKAVQSWTFKNSHLM